LTHHHLEGPTITQSYMADSKAGSALNYSFIRLTHASGFIDLYLPEGLCCVILANSIRRAAIFFLDLYQVQAYPFNCLDMFPDVFEVRPVLTLQICRQDYSGQVFPYVQLRKAEDCATSRSRWSYLPPLARPWT
jgi:hypothetical protein